jgi:hypothetical protein
MRESIHKLKISSDAQDRDVGYLLTHHEDMAMLGAIGPDVFFWAPDYDVVKKLYRLYKNLEEIHDQYEAVVEPLRKIRDAIGEPVKQTLQQALPHSYETVVNLVKELERTSKACKAALSTGLLAGVIEGANLVTDARSLPPLATQFFQEFIPDLQHNRPEQNWYWFDMLHYRRTGDFARKLLKDAPGDRSRAYAYGYLSHIATDVIGHGYVNQIVGGPYRLHVQRHATVENFMDCWAFWNDYGGSVSHLIAEKLQLPDSLPAEIRDLLYQSFKGTYEGIPHPTRLTGHDGFFTPRQIEEAYEAFYLVLQAMGKMGLSKPQEPFSGVGAVLAAAAGGVLQGGAPAPPNLSGAGGCGIEDVFSFGATPRSRECYKNFFEDMGKVLDHLGKLLQWALDKLLDLVDLLLTFILSLPITAILAILYGIQCALYEAYRIAHSVLALQGFIYPLPSELATSHGRSLVSTFQCCAAPFDEFPRWSDLGTSHLLCPPTVLEYPTTAADFYTQGQDVLPEQFIRQRPFDKGALQKYAAAADPQATTNLHSQGVCMGNAVDMTAWMIATAHHPPNPGAKDLVFTNWNLDADRGYGYKTWAGDIPPDGGQWVGGEDWA